MLLTNSGILGRLNGGLGKLVEKCTCRTQR